MPQIDTEKAGRSQQPRKKKLKKTVKRRVNVRPPDRQPAPKPKPPARRAVTPDQADRNRARLERGRTPDQADRSRSAQQKVRDKKVGDRNIRVAKETARARRVVETETGRPGSTAGIPQARIRRAAREIVKREKKRAATAAPVIKVLEQTTRPLHAQANAYKAAIEGKDVGKAALRGLQNKDKTTFSDVLKSAGVKNKAVAGTAGFALDVAADPLTYVTFGTGTVARKATLKAARDAEKKALKQGLSKDQAAKMGERAAKQAAKTADQSKGATVKVAGKEVPGVRKATAKAAKPVRAGGRKLAPKRAREAVRAVGADVNPNVAPAGVSKETARRAQQATRTARAKSNRGTHEAQQQALGIKQVGAANYSRIIDAIESGNIKSLPPELRDLAIRIRSQFRHANRQRKRAGIRGGEIKGRKRVDVPEVVADSGASAKELARARRAEAAAERARGAAETRHSVYQGRAEVLSRNVSGVRGEKAAERGRNKRKSRAAEKQIARTERRALERGLTPMQAKSAANRVRQELRAPRYAAGAKGVRDTADEVRQAELRLSAAAKARVQAETAHEAEKAAAAAQRAARKAAEETNAKRAVAPREYIPHRLTEEALEAERKASRAGATGRRTIRPQSSRARTDNRPLSELRKEKPGRYDEDLPTLYAERKVEGATSAARADLNRRVAELGTPVKKGDDVVDGLEKGESVYHVVGSDIRAVTDKKDLARLAETGSHSGPMKGRYVVLNDDIVKRAIEGAQPTLQGPGIVRGLDRVQGGFKRIALATPGFHVRNLVGDTQNAYLGQSGRRLPKNIVDAGRVLKAEGRRDKALRKLEPGRAGKGTVKTGRYGAVSYDEIAEQLSRHGAMRSGYTARELPELSGGERATLRRVRLPRRAKAALLNREDLPRVATAVEALKRGATWEQAAQRVTDYHFDYADLTSFERNIARRAAPFWTFTARNIPLQFKSLAKKPGKFANYQKLIEETQKAVGMDEEAQKHRQLADQLRAAGVKLPDRWESLMSEWEQRNAGVPISHRGQKFTVSFGLPLAAGLNEIPGAAGKKQVDEYFKTAMGLVTPIVKNPLEYFNNYSFFFRDQIERDSSPLVSAPSYVAGLPREVRENLGVVKGPDKRTGKNVWRWPGKVDYIVKTIPGLPQYAQSLATEGTNRRGKGTGGKVLQLFGVRAEPFDPERTLTNLAYERVGEIERKQARLRQTSHPENGRPINADNPTPEYTKLGEQRKVAQRVAYEGQRQQGYKVLPKQGAPKKPRLKVKQGFDFGAGGEEFDFSGGADSGFDFGG